MRELTVVRALRPLRRQFPGAVPAMVAIGLLAALSEGIGLSLFMPLLYSLDASAFTPATDNWLGGALQRFFTDIPADSRLWFVALTIMGLVLLKNLLVYTNDVISGWLDSRLAHYLRSAVAKQLLRVGIEFVDRKDSGSFVNILLTQTWETSSALYFMANILISIGTVSVFVLLLALISWKLTIAIVLGLGLVSVIARRMSHRVEGLSHKGVTTWDALTQSSLELIQRLRTVHAFARQDYEQDRFDADSRNSSRVYFKLDLLTALVRPVSEILIVGLLVSVVASLSSVGSLPMVLTFAFLLYRLKPHVQALDNARVQLLSLAAPVQAVMNFLDPSNKPYRPSGPAIFAGLRDSIRFDDVSFGYPGATKPTLRNIDITFPKGKTTALVGPSGAGKSTLIDLLVGLSEASTGKILVDGVPLAQLDIVSWRQHLGVARQDPQLFSATIRQNIAYGALGAADADIVRAAELAGADSFIRKLPEAYETQIGDQGVRLSDGQKQRIALARALIRQPEILILDDATNAVDSEQEARIQEGLTSLGQNRTVILISHRFSTVMQADHFVVLENGCVREQGDRQQLMERRGSFARLYGPQLSEAVEPHVAAGTVDVRKVRHDG